MEITQEELAKKHGTPEEFEKACWAAVPGFISIDEAQAAMLKYRAKWEAAGRGVRVHNILQR